VALVAATREAIRAQHGDALRYACCALACLACQSPERTRALVQAGAVEALVAATREAIRAKHGDALGSACLALASLAQMSPGCGQALVQAGAVEALVAATREAIRAQHEEALTYCLCALGTLAEELDDLNSPERAQARAQALVQAGAVEALVAATHEAIRAQHSLVAAVNALGTLVVEPPQGKRWGSGPWQGKSPVWRAALEAAGVADALIAAARARGVQGDSACKYLYNWALWSPEVSARVRREGLAGRVCASVGGALWLPNRWLPECICVW
jgi:hypothetical protein